MISFLLCTTKGLVGGKEVFEGFPGCTRSFPLCGGLGIRGGGIAGFFRKFLLRGFSLRHLTHNFQNFLKLRLVDFFPIVAHIIFLRCRFLYIDYIAVRTVFLILSFFLRKFFATPGYSIFRCRRVSTVYWDRCVYLRLFLRVPESDPLQTSKR